MNQSLLRPVADGLRSGLSWIGNTRAAQVSLQVGRQFLDYAVRVGRPVVIAAGTAVGGVVTVIFAVPELTLAAGILLVVVIIGGVIYLVRSN
jgi:hypothetical protein